MKHRLVQVVKILNLSAISVAQVQTFSNAIDTNTAVTVTRTSARLSDGGAWRR